ncbi:MAG: hypothetical protein LUF90_05835 [Rikenellaceae bacterium]|nr:hypothetical protein [Rikenellaceae bacterium]
MKKTIYSLLCSFLLFSCSDEKEFIKTGFNGDNHIYSFSLTSTNGEKYEADIFSDSIVITVPEGTSMKNAAVEYSISENSTIQPDPNSISNWDEEHRFLLLSYSESERIYHFKLTYKASETVENVILGTQEEVDLFAYNNTVTVTGNLIIGRAGGNEVIDDLSAMSSLQIVRGDIIFLPTFQGADLNGLSNLESAGSITITQQQNLCSVSNISLPKLKYVHGDMRIESDKLEDLYLPELIQVKGKIEITSSNLSYFKIDNLKYSGDILMTGTNNSGDKATLREMLFNGLEKCGDVILKNWYSLSLLDFPELIEAGRISLYECGYVECFKLPELRVAGSLEMTLGWVDNTAFPGSYVPRMSEFSCPALHTVTGSMHMDAGASYGMEYSIFLDFPSLRTIGGRLSARHELNFPILESIGENGFDDSGIWNNYGILHIFCGPNTDICFPRLNHVYGNVQFRNDTFDYLKTENILCPALEAIDGSLYIGSNYRADNIVNLDFSNLKNVDKVEISNNSQLTDFTTFRALTPDRLDDESWVITNCGYNPSWTDMLHGNYSLNQ